MNASQSESLFSSCSIHIYKGIPQCWSHSVWGSQRREIDSHRAQFTFCLRYQNVDQHMFFYWYRSHFICKYSKLHDIYIYIYACGLKKLFGWKVHMYDDIIFAIGDFFDQWDPRTGTPMEEVCWPQEETMLKNEPSLIHIPWEHLGQPTINFSADILYIHIYIYIYIYICVCVCVCACVFVCVRVCEKMNICLLRINP